MKVHKKALIAITLIYIFLIPSQSLATTRFSVLSFNPVPDGGLMFTVRESKTLRQWQWNLGTAADYAYKPLKATIGNSNINLVNRYIAQHFFTAVGFTDWFTVSVDLPVVWNNRFRNPDTRRPAMNEYGIGDLGMELKFRFLDGKRYPVGLALVPFVTFPTGKEEYFIGEDGITGGGKFVIDGEIGKRVTLALNIGVLARKRFNAYGLDFDEQFLASGGIAIKATNFLSIVGEMESRTPFGDFFASKTLTPTEGRAGLQWRFGRDNRFAINTGMGIGVSNGSYTPKYRGFASFSVKIPTDTKLENVRVEKFEDKTRIIAETPVLFAFDRSRINAEADEILHSIIDLLENNQWIQHITIAGFTDSIGSKSYNQTLGLRRADSVKKYLTDRGTDPDRITTVSYGEGDPAASNSTSVGRSMNRRVVIQVE